MAPEPNADPELQPVELDPRSPAGAPYGAAGFRFGWSLGAARMACKRAGFDWRPSPANSSAGWCTGAVGELGFAAQVQIGTCGEAGVCSIGIMKTVEDADPNAWIREYVAVAEALMARHGRPASHETEIPEDCREQLADCLESGRARISAWWFWSTGQGILMQLKHPGGHPTISLLYGSPELRLKR